MKKNLILLILIISSNIFLFAQGEQERILKKKMVDYPFIFGAQYYRAPTPSKDNWDLDLKHFAELGFTDIKFWLQWRWAEPAPDTYYFDDLDELIDIAEKYNLRVTINAIFDVAPIWLYKKYPNAKQVMNNGDTIQPYAESFRQIGGFPGPCYNHPGALAERKKFLKIAINHLKNHKNIAFWDVWNEPELSFPQRNGDLQKLVCYCNNCKNEFHKWLKYKYKDIETINKVWGRNYQNWDQVEQPKSTSTIKDFIDWREFQGYTMLNEAKWRLEMAKELDPTRITYLHVVPNTTQPFNAVTTCMDDFEVSKYCDVFAATMNNGSYFTPQVVSAANGKVCYNVESHINGGSITMYQSVINLNELLNDFLPQIGLGIKGFMFWQYRPEVLGQEAPAWGLTNLDGSNRVVTKAAESFWKTIRPYTKQLMKSNPLQPEVAIWKSQKNEIFNYCEYGNFNSLSASINAYSDFFYKYSFGFNYVNSEMVNNLSRYKVLIMPTCYYLTQKEADAIDKWVNEGGTLVNEAHLGAYNDDEGRHSYNVPGFGLNKKWGIDEVESTSTFRLKMDQKADVSFQIAPDLAKMLKDFETTGGEFVPIAMKDSSILWGGSRFAKIKAEGATALGYFANDYPNIIFKKIGKGEVYYCGTNIGEGSLKDKTGFNKFLINILKESGVKRELGVDNKDVWVKALYENEKMTFIVIRNMNEEVSVVDLKCKNTWIGLFSGMEIQSGKNIILPKGFCDLFVLK